MSLPTAEENLAALMAEKARAFVAKEYPVLLALQVIGATPSEDAHGLCDRPGLSNP